MNRLDNLLIGICALLVLLLACWFGTYRYGSERYNAGYAAAVAAGKAQHDKDAEAYQKLESDMRKNNSKRDADAMQKEQEYAKNLADAQRRVRAGTDRLRCPASTVQSSATPTDRPAPAEPTTDGSGPDLMPEAASDILGYGAAIASLVSRYDRVVERFEECRTVNAK